MLCGNVLFQSDVFHEKYSAFLWNQIVVEMKYTSMASHNMNSQMA